jgi:hypothetical protein
LVSKEIKHTFRKVFQTTKYLQHKCRGPRPL